MALVLVPSTPMPAVVDLPREARLFVGRPRGRRGRAGHRRERRRPRRRRGHPGRGHPRAGRSGRRRSVRHASPPLVVRRRRRCRRRPSPSPPSPSHCPARLPAASAPTPVLGAPVAPTTIVTTPEPRPLIAADVDRCPSLTSGVVPGHLVVTNLTQQLRPHRCPLRRRPHRRGPSRRPHQASRRSASSRSSARGPHRSSGRRRPSTPPGRSSSGCDGTDRSSRRLCAVGPPPDWATEPVPDHASRDAGRLRPVLVARTASRNPVRHGRRERGVVSGRRARSRDPAADSLRSPSSISRGAQLELLRASFSA